MTTPEHPLRLSAYYFEFQPTGVPEIDMILSAVACAGRENPHTKDWVLPFPLCEQFEGHKPVEWIQNAANAAAKKRATSDDVTDAVRKAMCQAWQLGQTYWQQADSESYKQNVKSDVTRAKFAALVDEVQSLLAQPAPATQDSQQAPVVAPPELPNDSAVWDAMAEWAEAGNTLDDAPSIKARAALQAYARQAVAEALAGRALGGGLDLKSIESMLECYISCIKQLGDYESWHYIPEVEEMAAALAAHPAEALARRDAEAVSPERLLALIAAVPDIGDKSAREFTIARMAAADAARRK